MSKSSIGAQRSVSPAVHLCILQPHGVGTGPVTGEQWAALIDCGSTPGQGAALLERARGFAGVPVNHVVVTHPYRSHQFGLAGMSGITSIVHEDLLCDPGAEVLDTAAAIGLSRLPASNGTFSPVRSLGLGGVHLEALHLGPAHIRADIVAVVPGEDVILMDDPAENVGDPQLRPAFGTGSWPKALGGALRASTETTRFISGYTPAGGEELTVDRESYFRQRAEIVMIQDTIEDFVHRGVTLKNALGSAGWPFDKNTIRVALPLAYRRLAREGVEPRWYLSPV